MRRVACSTLGRALTGAAFLLCTVGALAESPPEAVVEIRDYRFEPAELHVPVGTTVRWVNAERRTSHSILFIGEDGFESERMFPGETWEHRFERAGTYPYTCGPHPEMRGVVVVEP